MGKRFLILIGAAALGAALMAVGASANHRSVGDPKGDTRCFHDHGNRSCTDSIRRSADIVRATAGHEGTRLRHTIRVVGKIQSGAIDINTDSDRDCERVLYFLRGRGPSQFRKCGSGRVLGRARMDFHRHSVEIFFRRGSIGNPRGYGWIADAFAGPPGGHAIDGVPKRGRWIRHRLG